MFSFSRTAENVSRGLGSGEVWACRFHPVPRRKPLEDKDILSALSVINYSGSCSVIRSDAAGFCLLPLSSNVLAVLPADSLHSDVLYAPGHTRRENGEDFVDLVWKTATPSMFSVPNGAEDGSEQNGLAHVDLGRSL